MAVGDVAKEDVVMRPVADGKSEGNLSQPLLGRSNRESPLLIPSVSDLGCYNFFR